MILIYGKGATGKSLSSFMESQGIKYLIKDDEDFSENLLDSVRLIITSPGIPFYHRIYRLARKKGIEIIGDVEFAYRLYQGKIIAITGTDGKSTTTYMVGEFLKKEKPFVGGNYGEPFINAVKEKNPLAVLELSSFQIYNTKTFKPNIGVLLNISTDHLDWHKRESHYLLSKYKMFKRMKKENKAVLNFDQQIVHRVEVPAEKFFFSMEKLPPSVEGIYYCGQFLIYRIGNKTGKIDITDFSLKGEHNIQNLMAASLTALVHGASSYEIERTIPELRPLPYRIQFVKEINGIQFFNDSKSTTVQSVEKAVNSFKDRKVVLIAGGVYKGGDFSVLSRLENIKTIILIGKNKQVIRQMIDESRKPVVCSGSLEDAVNTAFKTAEKGDVVLFSPGCASFDMFKNYKDRGESFNRAVEKLIND
ncbi:UDP-N-acetylmuramoyl-L-alanine--D-glutamate ligase [Persephonella sp.]